jgi:hypothetical protein
MPTDSKQVRFTAMAAAFYMATIENPDSRVCRRIGRAIERNAGLVKERAVDARVSFRTAQKLKADGVL